MPGSPRSGKLKTMSMKGKLSKAVKEIGDQSSISYITIKTEENVTRNMVLPPPELYIENVQLQCKVGSIKNGDFCGE